MEWRRRETDAFTTARHGWIVDWLRIDREPIHERVRYRLAMDGVTNQNGHDVTRIVHHRQIGVLEARLDGSGTLATVTFDPASSTSWAREAADVPFSLSMIVLRNSQGQPIAVP